MRRQLKVVALSSLFFLFGISAVASAQNAARDVPYFAGPMGTAMYTLGQGLESVSKAIKAPVRIIAQESGSSTVLIKQFDRRPQLKSTHFFPNTTVTNWLAKEGKGPYKKIYDVPKVIGNQFFSSGWMVTFDSSLKKHEDLKGKRIAIGSPAQVIFGTIPKMIIDYGWDDVADTIDVAMLGHSSAATALLDRAVAASLMGIHILPVEIEGLEKGYHVVNPGSIKIISAGKKVYHIPWTENALRKAQRAGMPITTFTFPQGKVQDLEMPIVSWVDMIHIAAYSEFPNEDAYEITKMLINNYKRFREFHKLGHFIHPNLLTYGWNEDDLHPGALRAYKEAGLL